MKFTYHHTKPAWKRISAGAGAFLVTWPLSGRLFDLPPGPMDTRSIITGLVLILVGFVSIEITFQGTKNKEKNT